jgi:hypothetical protein
MFAGIEAAELPSWKACGYLIHLAGDFVRYLPHLQLFEVTHAPLRSR